MAAWMVALISWSVGHSGGVHAKTGKTETWKNGFGPQIPRHNLPHFCCAKLCHTKCYLFLIFPCLGVAMFAQWLGVLVQFLFNFSLDHFPFAVPC